MMVMLSICKFLNFELLCKKNPMNTSHGPLRSDRKHSTNIFDLKMRGIMWEHIHFLRANIWICFFLFDLKHVSNEIVISKISCHNFRET